MPGTRKNLLPLPPGLVLVVCAFLPAYYDSCAKTIYPFELGPILIPYALGLSVVVWSLAGSLGGRHGWAHWQLVALGHLCYWALGLVLLLAFGAAVADDESFTPTIGLFALAWLIPIRPALRSFARGRLPSWRAVRALWLGAFACSIWFSVWTLVPLIAATKDDKSHALFGSWLALAAALVLMGTGLLIARGAKATAEPVPATKLPATRVERLDED